MKLKIKENKQYSGPSSKIDYLKMQVVLVTNEQIKLPRGKKMDSGLSFDWQKNWGQSSVDETNTIELLVCDGLYTDFFSSSTNCLS